MSEALIIVGEDHFWIVRKEPKDPAATLMEGGEYLSNISRYAPPLSIEYHFNYCERLNGVEIQNKEEIIKDLFAAHEKLY